LVDGVLYCGSGESICISSKDTKWLTESEGEIDVSASEESERDSNGTECVVEGVVDNNEMEGKVAASKPFELRAKAGLPIGECTAGGAERKDPAFHWASYEVGGTLITLGRPEKNVS
jgi:hypothetical protein